MRVQETNKTTYLVFQTTPRPMSVMVVLVVELLGHLCLSVPERFF